MSRMRRLYRAEANPHDSDLLPIYGTKVACNGLRVIRFRTLDRIT